MTTTANIRKTLQTTVAYIGNTQRRAFDAVVFELADSECRVQRTVILRTSSTLHRALDTKRSQRMSRRLQAMGYRINWSAFGHPQDGIGGTVRMYRKA